MGVMARIAGNVRMASACHKASLVVVPLSVAFTAALALATGNSDWLAVAAIYGLMGTAGLAASLIAAGATRSCPMANLEEKNAG